MADDKGKPGSRKPAPPMTQHQKDKAAAKDPDIRGVNRQESRRG